MMSKGLKTFTEESLIGKTIEELNEMHLDVKVTEEGASIVRSFPLPIFDELLSDIKSHKKHKAKYAKRLKDQKEFDQAVKQIKDTLIKTLRIDRMVEYLSKSLKRLTIKR